MPAPVCHFPIIVRINGELDDDGLGRLAAAVEQAVGERMAAAERELDRRAAASTGTAIPPEEPPSEPTVAERLGEGDQTYRVPSYHGGGGSVSLPVAAEPARSSDDHVQELVLAWLRELVASEGTDSVWGSIPFLRYANPERRITELRSVHGQERQELLRRAGYALMAEILRFQAAFPEDVKSLAYRYLDLNKSWLYRERDRLGLSISEANRSGEQEARLRNLRRLVTTPALAQRLQRLLMRSYRLGLAVTTTSEGRQRFITHEEFQAYQSRLQEVIDRYAREQPEFYLLIQRGSYLEAIARAAPAKLAEMLDADLTDLNQHIEDARDKIRTGDIDWLDLVPLHERLFHGERSASGIDWSAPYPQRVARDMVGNRRAYEFWKQLGLDTLAAAAFIFAEIATGGAATFFLTGGVGITAFQVGRAWQRAGGLEAAGGASARKELELVTREQVLRAEDAALLTAVLGLAAAAGPVARGLGRAARLAREATAAARIGKAVTLSEEEAASLLQAPEAELEQAAAPPQGVPATEPPAEVGAAGTPAQAEAKGTTDAAATAPGRARGLQPIFMRKVLAKILADENHPLRFLVDVKKGNWLSRTHLSELPTVQAGHLVSFHSGAPEALALEDSFFNQVSNWKGERFGAIFEKAAVDIGEVPVEVRTAELWESLGVLEEGTVDRAMRHAGWTRE